MWPIFLLLGCLPALRWPDSLRSPKRRRRQALLAGFALLLLTFGGLIAAAYPLFKKVGNLNRAYPRLIYKGEKVAPIVKFDTKRPPSWVSIENISRLAVGAIIVSEDWAFYSHPGYDLKQIRESIEENLRAGRYKRGASTISQQVARNVFLTKEKTLWRKIKELLITMMLEEQVSKRRILEIYLNIAEWNAGMYGIGAASRYYFGKSPAGLGAKEGAFLAMLLPNPRRNSASFRRQEMSGYATKTVESILDKMVQAGYLSSEDRQFEAATPLPFEKTQEVLDAPSSSEAPSSP